MTKPDWYSFDALISVIPTTLAPIIAMLKTETNWNWQNLTILVLLALTGFFGGLAAYRSMKFAVSKGYTLPEKPQQAE